MFTRSRFVRSLAALGTAVATASAALILGTGTATAQERITTSWRVDGAPSPLGPDSLTLVRADDSEEILDATGDITESFSGPAWTMRRYALLFDYFNPSEDTAVTTSTGGGITTITGTYPHSTSADPPLLKANGSSQHVWNNAMFFGEIGSYTATATYSGDGRYRETTYAYDVRLDRLEDVPTLQPTTLTIDAFPSDDGVLPITVTSDRDLGPETMYQCARYDAEQAYWRRELMTATSPRTFSGSCELDEGYSGAVVIFVLSMDGPGEIIIVDPATGGTNAGVDPADSLGPGHQLTVSGVGLEPNREYVVSVESTPRNVGTFTTDAQGSLTAQVTIPDDLGDGHHHLVLRDGITGAEVQRHPFTFSQRADPTRPVTIEVVGGTDPVGPDPAPTPGSSLGSLGSS